MLQVHDSVVVQCLPEEMAQVAYLIKSSLEIPIEIEGADHKVRICKIPVDLQAGWNWNDLVKVKEPFDKVPERMQCEQKT
jgi:DNA polymerase I-like protein with 3'-5' exonuclease and polymerase domains